MNTEQTRAAFEAWTGYSEEALSRDAGDGYCIKGVDNEWRAWQAALASPEVRALWDALVIAEDMLCKQENELRSFGAHEPCAESAILTARTALAAMEKQK